MARTEPSPVFAASYVDARERFLAAANEAGAVLEGYVHPALRGVAGEPLVVDTALLGSGDPQRLLVLNAGTHGVEGYPGSDALSWLIEQRVVRSSTPTRVLMIHGLNPHGMSHGRRVNENNVDLNRNFGGPDPASASDPAHAGPAAWLHEPRRPGLAAGARFGARLVALLLHRRGRQALGATVQEGQRAHPRGLFYAGRSQEWSVEVLRHIVQSRCADVRHLVFIDMHAGIGRRGALELVTSEPEESPDVALARSLWGSHVRCASAGQSSSGPVRGAIRPFLKALLPGRRVVCLVLEVGTCPRLQTLYRLWSENGAHFRGDAAQIRRARRSLRSAFAPEDPAWRDAYRAHVHGVVARALATAGPGECG